jgi:hypothetical protein
VALLSSLARPMKAATFVGHSSNFRPRIPLRAHRRNLRPVQDSAVVRGSMFFLQPEYVDLAHFRFFFNPRSVLKHQNMLFYVDEADYAHNSGFHNQEKHKNEHLHGLRHHAG